MSGKFVAAATLFAAAVCAATVPQTPLTTVAQAHGLPTAIASQGLPVVLRGVVTQWMPEWRGFSMQDGTDAVYVMGAPVEHMDLTPGRSVELHGRTAPGSYAPIIDASTVKIIGTAPMPRAIPADWNMLSSGGCDNRYVYVTGVVRSVVSVKPPTWRWPATAIHLDLGGNVIWVYVRHANGYSFATLPDDKVQISGTCVTLSNSRKRFERNAVLVWDASNAVRILSPGEQSLQATPLTTIDHLFPYIPGQIWRRRVRVEGTVVWAHENRVFIQNGNNSVLVRTVLPETAHVGDVVQAVGFPTAGDYSAEMEDAELVQTGKREQVSPVDVKSGDLVSRFHEARPMLPDSMLIRLPATVLGVTHSTAGEVLALRDGSSVFSALLPTGTIRIHPDSRITVTGVCQIQLDEYGVPQGFQILLRSPDDVRVLRRPSWVTRSLALRAAAIGLGVAFLALVIVALLTRRVGLQRTVIKQQKRREEELGRRMRELVENASDLVYVLGIDGRILHLNFGAERLTGYSRREQISRNITELLTPTEREAFRNKLASRRPEEAARFEQSEWTFVRKDGSRFCVELSQRFVADQDGGHVEAIGRDVTARKQAMFDNEERFRTLADNIPQLAWMADASGSIVWFNDRWFEYTGAAAQESLGDGWKRWHHPEHVDRVWERMRECFLNGETWEDSFPLRGQDGQFRWFLARGLPIRDETGKVVRWFGTNTDITEQKEIETELQRSNDDLRQFAYVASHDLQEPLRNVCNYTQMLARSLSGSELTAKRSMYMDIVIGGAKRMESMISDLLAYSRTTGATELERPKISMGACLEAALENLRLVIEESSATIRRSDMPTLYANPLHLTQVFQNLVGNAIKYRRQGVAPSIQVQAEEQVDRWLFSVADNGSGFDPRYAEKMFGIFKRLHGREVPGTGIGLAICKAMIERHGGRIWAEGTPGKGATFYFTLPKGEVRSAQVEDPEAEFVPE